jgi:hypothetical protein
VTIVEVLDLHHDRSPEVEAIERALASPVAIRVRDELERRLARARAG